MLCDKLQEELEPVGVTELFLVRRIALAMTRLARASLIEAEFITADLNPTVSEGSTGDFLVGFLSGSGKVLDPGLPARLSISAVEELVTKFQRYETAIENKLYRAMNQLEATRLACRKNSGSGEPTTLRLTE